jgi:hypothetical protein
MRRAARVVSSHIIIPTLGLTSMVRTQLFPYPHVLPTNPPSGIAILPAALSHLTSPPPSASPLYTVNTLLHNSPCCRSIRFIREQVRRTSPRLHVSHCAVNPKIRYFHTSLTMLRCIAKKATSCTCSQEEVHLFTYYAELQRQATRKLPRKSAQYTKDNTT